MENRPRPPRPAPRPGRTEKEPAAPGGGSALATVKLTPEQTAELTKQAGAGAATGAGAAAGSAPATVAGTGAATAAPKTGAAPAAPKTGTGTAIMPGTASTTRPAAGLPPRPAAAPAPAAATVSAPATVSATAPATVSATVSVPAPVPAPVPATATVSAPAAAPAPATVSAPAAAPEPAQIPGDRSALATVRLPPEEVAMMARPMLDTVPISPEEAAPLIEQTRSGVPGEEPRTEGLRSTARRPHEGTITKTLVSAHDEALAAALAAGRLIDVKLAEAADAPQAAAPSSEVAAISNADASQSAFRPHAGTGDRTFASSEAGAPNPGAPAAYVPRARPAPSSPRWLLPAVAAASFCVVFALALGFLALRGSFSTPSSAPTASTSAAPAPTEAPTSSSPVAATASTAAVPSPPPSSPEPAPTPAQPLAQPTSPPEQAPPSATSAEAQAREALTRLSEGIAACARDTIGVLPGTSPAVPPATSFLAKGPYTSIPRDWSTPVFACAKFRLEGPQPFQIQWQVVKPSAEGLGVAWLDENADGKADRALGFRATLKDRNQPEMGPIGPLDPIPPVAPPPR